MKRKLLELKAARAELLKTAEAALASADKTAYDTAMEQIAKSNQDIADVEKLLDEQSKAFTASQTPAAPTEKKATGFDAMLKMLRGAHLNEDEAPLVQKALITGADAVSGENYLVPEDVKTEIREMRKSYVSAKELVNVIPVDTLTGSTNFESGTPSGLTDFDDGDTIATEGNPTFVKKAWTIGFRGKLIPVSRVLSKLAGALNAYLNRWFVRNAIISENSKIFTILKAGYNSGAPKAIAGLAALKKSINEDLDPSALLGGVIATNQSGFAAMDDETDANGRPMLEQDPANPTRKLYQGMPIKVYPNAQLPNIDGTHFPVFYGDTKAGCDFMEYGNLLFEVSEHFLFDKNQNCMRMIEGFDAISTDTSAYIYGSFSAAV